MDAMTKSKLQGLGDGRFRRSRRDLLKLLLYDSHMSVGLFLLLVTLAVPFWNAAEKCGFFCPVKIWRVIVTVPSGQTKIAGERALHHRHHRKHQRQPE